MEAAMNSRARLRELTSVRRFAIGVMVGLYLYFLLPATATLFYELYHLTGVGPIYWGYSVFKAAGYYFGTWAYQLPVCLFVAAAIIFLPGLLGIQRRN